MRGLYQLWFREHPIKIQTFLDTRNNKMKPIKSQPKKRHLIQGREINQPTILMFSKRKEKMKREVIQGIERKTIG